MTLFSSVDLETRVRKDHPLRAILCLVNEALRRLRGDFSVPYSGLGRPSIAPERLFRAMLLQAFHSIRSERRLMERLEFDLPFRWFVGPGVDDPVREHSMFSKNRDHLLAGDVAAGFLSAILIELRVRQLSSSEHFSVDGTLIEAWASMKSFKPKARASDSDDPTSPPSGGRNADADLHDEKRTNGTHAATTDPEAWPYRKGPGLEVRRAFPGHALTESHSGLLVDTCLTEADGHAERIAVLSMSASRADRPQATTYGIDRGHGVEDFIDALRSMNARPHAAQNSARRGGSAIDGRTTRHEGHVTSQRIRKRVEGGFGSMKSVAEPGRPILRGRARVGWAFTFATAAHGLVRWPELPAVLP